MQELFDEAGVKIAQKLIQDFPDAKSFSFVVGLSGNATDALSTAIALNKLNTELEIDIYLIGRKNLINHPIGRKYIDEISKNKNINLHNDCYASDVKQSEVNIEALVGTGLEGNKLNKRFYDVIKRISHFQNKLVAIDIAAPGYTPDLTYSLNYPKTYDAIEIKLTNAENYLHLVGPGDAEELWVPNTKTHTAKNGKLVWIGSEIENFELCKQVASEYQVETRGILITEDENEARFKKLNFENSFNNAFEWADHCVFDEFETQDIVITSVLKEFAKKYYAKSTLGLQLFNKVDKAKIVHSDRISDKNNEIKKSLAYQIEVGIVYDAKLTTYFSGEFRIADVNFKYSPKLKLLFLYLVSAYATKNSAWSSARAAMFQISSKLMTN